MPALEENILKYRALQMVLFIFHAESLKRLVDGAIDALEFAESIRLGSLPRRKVDRKRRWQKLVDKLIITPEEAADLTALFDYRNLIAHEVHTLTKDIGSASRKPWVTQAQSRYDYEAINRLRKYREKIEKGMGSDFVIPISGDTFYFELAERTYRKELSRLDVRIERQLEIRRSQIDQINSELRSLDRSVLAEFNLTVTTTDRGTLTPQGVEMCWRLFESGLSAPAAARLLGISPRSTKRRYTQLRRQGGKAAPTLDDAL